MKKLLIRASAAIFILSMILMIMSCGSGPQNVNQNKTSENAGIAAAPSPSPVGEPCDQLTIQLKLDKMEEWIIWKVSRDSKLKDQYREGNFGFGFVPGSGSNSQYGFILVEGAIGGQKGFKQLAEFIEDYVKAGCNLRVVYVPAGTISNLGTRRPGTDPLGFEWCEAPLVACPGGYCAPACDRKVGNSNGNGNSNSGANANTNSNSNSNVNRRQMRRY